MVNGSIRKNILVCLRSKCCRCHIGCKTVRDDCQVKVLHMLDHDDLFGKRARKSGKTTRLVTIANEMADLGNMVYYVTPTFKMRDEIRNRHHIHDGVIVMSSRSYDMLRGKKCGLVIIDDVMPSEVYLLDLTGHIVVAHYWSDL